MENIAGKKPALIWAVHISVGLLVLLWIIPTLGLLVSSFRSGDQIVGSGWWKALFTQEQQMSPIRLAGEEVQKDGLFVVEGQLFTTGATVSAWGTSSRDPAVNEPGQTVDLTDGQTLTVQADGTFSLTSPVTTEGARLPRVGRTQLDVSRDATRIRRGSNAAAVRPSKRTSAPVFSPLRYRPAASQYTLLRCSRFPGAGPWSRCG